MADPSGSAPSATPSPKTSRRKVPEKAPWGKIRFLPPFAAALAVSTILAARQTSVDNGTVPADAGLIPISLIVATSPAREMYAVGLTAASALFLAMALPFARYLRAAVEAPLQVRVPRSRKSQNWKSKHKRARCVALCCYFLAFRL